MVMNYTTCIGGVDLIYSFLYAFRPQMGKWCRSLFVKAGYMVWRFIGLALHRLALPHMCRSGN